MNLVCRSDISEACFALRKLGHADEHLLARMNIELFGGFTRQPKDALSGDDAAPTAQPRSPGGGTRVVIRL